MPFQNPFMQTRQRNILAPQGGFGPHMPQRAQPNLSFDFEQPDEEPQPRHQDGYGDELMKLQGTMGPGLQAYKQYLSTMPNRDDYKPNVMTRIAAALSGGAAGLRNPGEGVRVASSINDAGYDDALKDYSNRGIGLKEQAGLEQDELDSKIRALQNARAMGLKYDEFALKQLEAKTKMGNETTTANAAMKRAEAYAAAQTKPRHRYEPQQDGSVLEINEDAGTQRVIPAKTVAAGQLGVAQRNASTAATNAQTARGQLEVSRSNAGVNAARGAAYVENLGRDKTKPPTPRVQADAEQNALSQMKTDPIFSDFITTDKNGYPTVVEDDGSEEYQTFLEALDAKTEEVLKGTTKRKRVIR